MGQSIKLDSPVNPISGIGGQDVIVLAKHFAPTPSQLKLLKKGLSFIPTTQVNNFMKKQLKSDLQIYHRRLLLTTFFEYRPQKEIIPFVPKSPWTPKLSQVPNSIRKIIRANNYALTRLRWSRERTSNVSYEDKQALKQLRDNTAIVIKPADKGSAVVIMDREQYIWEAERQLRNTDHYVKLDKFIYTDTIPMVKNILSSLKEGGFINRKQETYLIGSENPRPRRFYLLPKIHKAPETWSIPFQIPPGRPIVSDCNSETYATAEYIESFLNPISTKHPSYIRDSYDFIHKIKELIVPEQALLFTIDVESLYTNIETEAGLEAVKDWFQKYPNRRRPDKQVLELLKINLTRNDFEFNSQYYLQVKGTAMGKRFAPSYANIFMAKWEEAALATWPIKPLHYFRFLDDIWGVWLGTREQFMEFADHLNTFHSSIKIKFVLHDSEVNFLDTVTYKGSDFQHTRRLDVKIYFKDTDTHALLHRTSFHPRHTFRGIIKSQLLRFHRICSQPQNFWDATRILFTALKKRGYSRSFLRYCLKTFQHKKAPEEREIIPLVTTFSTSSASLNRKAKENFEKTLKGELVLQKHKVISAYRKNKNLGDILVRSKLPPPPPLQSGGKTTQIKEYQFKPWIINKQTKQLFRVEFSCDSTTSNCVYLIFCQVCDMQYVGQTKNSIATRIIQHKYNIKNKKETQRYIVQHFCKHGLEALRIMGLQSNPNWSRTDRLQAEAGWITKLNTRHPWGLNEC